MMPIRTTDVGTGTVDWPNTSWIPKSGSFLKTVTVTWDSDKVRGVSFIESEGSRFTGGEIGSENRYPTSTSFEFQQGERLKSAILGWSGYGYGSLKYIKLVTSLERTYEAGDHNASLVDLTSQVHDHQLLGLFGHVNPDNFINRLGLWIAPPDQPSHTTIEFKGDPIQTDSVGSGSWDWPKGFIPSGGFFLRSFTMTWDGDKVRGLGFALSNSTSFQGGELNNEGRYAVSSFQFQDGEKLETAILGWSSYGYNSWKYIKFTTSAGNTFEGGDGNCTKVDITADVRGQTLLGFYGHINPDNFINRLGLWVTGDQPAPKNVIDHVDVNGVKVTLQDFARFAPVVHLHTWEAYLPCSIDFMLSHSTLMDNKTGKPVKEGRPTQKDLETYKDDHYYLKIDPQRYNGDYLDAKGYVRAPMYVNVQVPPGKDYVDFNYWFLYMFNGAQTARVRDISSVFVGQKNIIIYDFAQHEGDLENITVRVSRDLKTIKNVYYYAHGDAHAPPHVEKLQYTGTTHPHVFSAFNSHASYKTRTDDGGLLNPNDWTTLDDYKIVSFIDIYTRDGPIWQPFEFDDHTGETKPTNQLIVIGFDEHGNPINEQNWAAFSGRLGCHFNNSATAVHGIGNDDGISGDLKTFVLSVAKIVQPRLSGEQVEGDGPSGFGSRKNQVGMFNTNNI